jgi:hypothetical protein
MFIKYYIITPKLEVKEIVTIASISKKIKKTRTKIYITNYNGHISEGYLKKEFAENALKRYCKNQIRLYDKKLKSLE